MGYSNFTIDGVPIKNPDTFNISYYTLTKSTRVANGNMVMDYVANKRKFNFGYNKMESPDMNNILYLLWDKIAVTKQCFAKLGYYDDGVKKEAVIYAGEIPKHLHRADGKIWVWKSVNFSLIER